MSVLFFIVNLSTIGNEDSSSEENDNKAMQKPVVPPRTRSANLDAQISRKNINSKEKPKGNFFIVKFMFYSLQFPFFASYESDINI